MTNLTTLFVGLDVNKDSTAVKVAVVVRHSGYTTTSTRGSQPQPCPARTHSQLTAMECIQSLVVAIWLSIS